MNVEKVFSTLSAHGIRGMMIHDQLANYYDFLSLHGMKRCHEYHFYCETKAHRDLQRYYLSHYNRLISEGEVDSSDIIPASWYSHVKQDVDASTKRNAVSSGLDTWINWEKSTKEAYSQAYHDLCEAGESTAAEYVLRMIGGVEKELKTAERMKLAASACDYDMTYIVEKQGKLHKKYKRKNKEINL